MLVFDTRIIPEYTGAMHRSMNARDEGLCLVASRYVRTEVNQFAG
jgi:hypothetical protein